MEDNRRINIDYIAVIRQDGNLVKYEQIDIPKPEGLLSDLEGILNNPDGTILELQSRMCEFYEEDKRKNVSYLPHYYYTNPHTLWYVSFPKIYHPDEYQEMIQEIEARMISKNSWTLSRIRERDTEAAYQEKLNGYIKEALQREKDEYYRQCLKFITAITYEDAVDEYTKDPTIIMCSGAFCGCWSKDLKVNSDIVLRVNAQLGYSHSSTYLAISLWYKSRLIEPYSSFVSHFKKYVKYPWYIVLTSPHTRCWDEIFKSAAEMANMATTDPDQFYNKYIKDELKKMISGLTYIVEKPKYFIDSLIDDKDSYFEHGIKPEHVKTYREFPDDWSMALIADKLSDAHKLLSNLADLAEFEPTAQSAYDTIKGYITRMLPRAKEYYATNSNSIEKLSKSISDTESKLQELKNRIAAHTPHIDERYEKGFKHRSLIEADYERECYDYRYLKGEIKRTEQTNSSLWSLRFGRKQITESLKNFIDTVTKSDLLNS